MPFDASMITGGVTAEAGSVLPTCFNGLRSNLAAGIPSHVPMVEMFAAACKAWVDVMGKTPIIDAYVGVVGGTAKATPVPVTFPAAAAAQSALQASMAWVGPSAPSVCYLLTTAISNQTTAQALLNMNPLPGAGVGASTVNPAVNPQMAGLTAAFQAALTASFTKGSVPGMAGFGFSLFSPLDSGVGITPEILLLTTKLSIAFTTMASSVTAIPLVYAGGASPSPFSAPNLGFLA